MQDYWLHELDTHAASMEPVKMVVANKTDMVCLFGLCLVSTAAGM